MTAEARLREQICLLAKSIFDRGLTGGSTGNISARTEDGGLLVSPTGSSFGRLDPARLSRFDKAGQLMAATHPRKKCRFIPRSTTRVAQQVPWFICIHATRWRCH